MLATENSRHVIAHWHFIHLFWKTLHNKQSWKGQRLHVCMWSLWWASLLILTEHSTVDVQRTRPPGDLLSSPCKPETLWMKTCYMIRLLNDYTGLIMKVHNNNVFKSLNCEVLLLGKKLQVSTQMGFCIYCLYLPRCSLAIMSLWIWAVPS